MTEHYAVESDGQMLEKGTYDAILVRDGKSFGEDGDLTTTKRILGPVEVIGVARTFESARSDEDRGNARVLMRRGSEYFVAGCKFSTWAGETNYFYVEGPFTLHQVKQGVGEQPDLALLNSARLNRVEEI